VTLTYLNGTTKRESRFDWEVVDGADLSTLLSGLMSGVQGEAATGWGIDLKTAVLQRVRKAVFDPQGIQLEREMAEHRNSAAASSAGAAAASAPPRADTSLFPDVYERFGTVNTPSGEFGYIRLKSFAPGSGDVNGAVQEFARLLGLMPPRGLILDVRGNGGGYVNFGERILQMLTPRPITPQPFHFLATEMTYRMAQSNAWLREWQEPIAQAIETGASFSQGFPLTPFASCNDIGQIYQGPVVLATDALCYSTTDIFAAGFQDHEIGKILGVHNNTGAGGANVWDHQQVLQQLSLPPNNPFLALPKGAGMRTAVRRSTRVGARSGVPLEDLGVAPDAPYLMTKADVTNGNADLIAAAAKMLKGMDTQRLRLSASGGTPVQHLSFECEKVDRIDLLLEGRPILSKDVSAGTGSLALPFPVSSGSILTGNGYRSGKLVVSTRGRV
jgi:C-terminal processing protease CtpA/Prc